MERRIIFNKATLGSEGFLDILNIEAKGIEVYPTPHEVFALYKELIKVNMVFQNIEEVTDDFKWEAFDQHDNFLGFAEILSLASHSTFSESFFFSMPDDDVIVTIKTYHWVDEVGWVRIITFTRDEFGDVIEIGTEKYSVS